MERFCVIKIDQKCKLSVDFPRSEAANVNPNDNLAVAVACVNNSLLALPIQNRPYAGFFCISHTPPSFPSV